jgi:hypothetical protein
MAHDPAMLEEAMKIDGQCHCGMVSFEATIDPARVSVCHCTDCQTLTGSPFRRHGADCAREYPAYR